MKSVIQLFSGVGLLFLAGCASSPPENQKNICSIFREHDHWYADAKATQKKWGTPIPVLMAFIKQESAFVHNAKPPRKFALGFIPWGRLSSAYGYSQALDGSWDDYQDATGSWGRRTSFEDSLDFMGWYMDQTQKELGISKTDAYRQYLAYHEGWSGFRKGTYKRKSWLQKTARRVSNQATQYTSQLKSCRRELDRSLNSWWPF